jgi:UDP-glucose:glycoprotein glucosyltransferase
VGTSPDPGTLYINGVEVSVSGAVFNVFDVLKTIREEVRTLQQLDRLPLAPSSLKDLLTLASSPSRADLSNVRIDVYRGAKGALYHLNNVEKDPQYQRWPKSLRQLLYPSWQLQALSRNLYSLTLVIDPSEPEALQALHVVQDLYTRTFPIRFSVVLVARDQVSFRPHIDHRALL